MIKKVLLLMIFASMFFTGGYSLYAQSIGENALKEEMKKDTTVVLSAEELENVPTIHSVYEKQQEDFQAPVEQLTPLKLPITEADKNIELKILPEAAYLASKPFDPSTYFYPWVTYRDTIVVNPLFMPLMVRGNLVDLKTIRPEKVSFTDFSYEKELPDWEENLFVDFKRRKEVRRKAYSHIRTNHPEYFRYSELLMPGKQQMIESKTIEKTIKEERVFPVFSDVSPADMDAPVKFIPERRYWTSRFESSLQFAQSHVSENWHKGGNSNMNILGRVYLTYNYKKEKVKITNSIEVKAQVYNAPNDTLRKYKIGNDLLQLTSNIGYEAFKYWYYTVDVDFRTQLFNSFQENSETKQASFLAPFSITLGLGMKYDLNKKFDAFRHRSLELSANIAPLSFDYRYSINKKIDLRRHGFEKKEDDSGEYKHSYLKIGSSATVKSNFRINRDIRWVSRLYAFTPYEQKILIEFENKLEYAFSRFFTAEVNLHMRYDNRVIRPIDEETGKPKYSYLQVNELLTLGFSYRW